MAWVEIPLCSVALFVGIIVLDIIIIIIIIIICNIIIILVFCSKELRHLIVGALQAGSLLVVGCPLFLSFPLSLSFSLQLPFVIYMVTEPPQTRVLQAGGGGLPVVGCQTRHVLFSPVSLSTSLHLRPSQAPPSHLCFFDIVIIGLERSHPSSSTAELIALMFFSSVNLNQSSSLIFFQAM